MMLLKKVFQNYKNISRIGLLDLFFALAKEGIGAFLLLYLVKSLLFSDEKAYEFMGLKDVVAYIIPFLAAVAFAPVFPACHSAVLGLFFMGIGCACLSVGMAWSLKIGFGFFLLGYGLGRPTLPVLLVEKISLSIQEKETRIRSLYLFSHLAQISSPLLVGFISALHSYEAAFLVLSAVCIWGSFLAVVLLKQEGVWRSLEKKQIKYLILAGGLPWIFCLPFFFPVVKNALILLVGLGAVAFLIKAFYEHVQKDKMLMKQSLMVMGIMVIYFMLQNQMNLFVILYAERFVDRTVLGFTFHTPWFYSFAPFFMLMVAPFLTPILSSQKKGMFHRGFLAFSILSIIFICVRCSFLFPFLALPFLILSFLLLDMGGFLLVPTAEVFINGLSQETVKRKFMGLLYLSMAVSRFFSIHLCEMLLKKEGQGTALQDSYETSVVILCSVSACLALACWVGYKNRSFVR